MSRRPFRSPSLPLKLQALDRRDLPSAVLPFSDGFEAATLGSSWAQSATNNGAISVTTGFSPISGTRHVMVGPSASGINSRSELILHLDLGGVKNAVLTFKEKEFNDLDHPMPTTFTGTSNSDGVAFSVDGTNWYRIVSLTGTASQNVAQSFTYNLGQIAAANGLELTGDTVIKFQNYSNQAAPNGGFAFDDVSISISGNISGKVYQDVNKDGAYQVGEPLEVNKGVYLDSNNDGKLTVGTETLVFSEQLPAPILDTKRSLYPLHVTGFGNPLVGDVDVTIALVHTFDGDLDISLISPDGRRVLLTSDNGGSGDNYYGSKFDDDASVSITAGNAPFNGLFKPEGKLSDFVGAPINGWWFLEIVDDTGSDSGTLAGWSLDLGRVYKSVVNAPISESQVNYFYVPIDDPSYDDMDVVVNIDHPNVGDLSILLATPMNDWVNLTENNGGTGNNFTNTRFDDEASVSITTGTAPFNGHYRPLQKLSTFEDLGVVYGQYELRLADDVAGNVGTLKDFSVILTDTWIAGADPVTAGNPGGSDHYAYFFAPKLPGPIADLDVLVDIDHNNDQVLQLQLYNDAVVDGPTLALGYASGGASGKNFTNTLFDDEANLPLESGVAPYTGSYRPLGNLSKFDGMSAEGNWKLRVDNTAVASGELNWAALVFRTTNVETDITARLINDQSTTTAPFNVSGLTGTIADLNVQVKINHTYDGDLDVYLTAPNGKTVELFTDVGASGDNFTNTVLDDEAAVSIIAGSAPFAASFRPEGSLAGFDGFDPNGTWTLTITDDAPGDSGLLLNWSLIITTGERVDVTDANGEYSFDNIAPGTPTVRIDVNDGYSWVNPVNGKRTLNVAYGSEATDQDFGYVLDSTEPEASLLSPTPMFRNTPATSVDSVFTEPVTGVDISDFTLTLGGNTLSLAGATVTTNDNITWTISNLAGLQMADGNYKLTLNPFGSGIIDLAKNPITSYPVASTTWYLDTVAPQILKLALADPPVTNLEQVRWDYDFSEGLYGLSATNFALSGSAAAGAKIVSVIGGYVYVDVWNNGTLTLQMANSNSTHDGSGNEVSNLPYIGETYTITRPILQVTNVQVNDGTAQRSKVNLLTVTFNTIPDFAGDPTAAFQLKRQSDGALVTLSPNWSDNVVTLSFTGGPLDYGSLADGRYDLTIFHDQIANFDGNANGIAGDDYVFNFHRLFGDSDGNAVINSVDFAAFRNVFGLGGISPFDFNGDFGVNSNDFAEFRKRFGLTI